MNPRAAGMLLTGLLPLLAFLAFSNAATHAATRPEASAEPVAQELTVARRTLNTATTPVSLPDSLAVTPEQRGLAPVYAFEVDLGPAPSAMALYVPGLLNRARVHFNGHLVFDSLRPPQRPGPRGPDRLLLVALPDEFLTAGSNRFEIALEAPRWTSLSPVWVGPDTLLRSMYERKRWWQVYAPVVSASIIMALSVSILLLWLRRRGETLYAYFGIGGVVWAVHNVWGVLPDPFLPYPHFVIWWNLGFGFFVAPISVFCVRLAQWRVPRLERAVWVILATGPPVVYAAHGFDALGNALMLWRLVWIGVIGVGVVAVGYFALRRRDLHAALLILAATTAFVFGVVDWLSSVYGFDNNPVLLTHFSGLVFFPLVASMLIDGFVRASRDLERLNADLEQRVASKSAELLAALDSMRAARDDAQAANRAKSRFLAAASHDLRQPMHALGLYMAALSAESGAAARLELMERMNASVGVLDSLFDALLDISRLDAGAVEPRPSAFVLEPLLHRLGAEFAAQAAERGLRLSVRVAPVARTLNAFSDPLLVERILRNLLANAVKYTEEGGVLIACRLRAAASATPHWQIDVWDSGPGIPHAESDRIFEEFYQLGNPERSRSAGLGLGLSIVRRLTHLLGHRLSLRSRPGHGSRFSIELPSTIAPAAEPEPPVSAAAQGAIEGLGVAVIDDDPDVRDSMKTLLTRWGCSVLTGATAAEVLAHAGAEPGRRVQAAVVDYQLRDGQTGIDAIRTLRSACDRDLPVLVVSGASSPQGLAEVKASGYAWLSKPVRAQQLRGWLVQAAGRDRA